MANYYVFNDGVAYLENLYIYPEKRKSQRGTSLLSNFEMELENKGIKAYFTTISRSFGNPDLTLSICLKRGMKFNGSNNDSIFMKKEF